MSEQTHFIYQGDTGLIHERLRLTKYVYSLQTGAGPVLFILTENFI
jgi:hypothetical protein